MRDADLSCAGCGKVMENTVPGKDESGLSSAVMFVCHGGYGSEYDPWGTGEYLVIAVCDPCLWSWGDAGNVMRVVPRRVPAPAPSRQRWEPGTGPEFARTEE